MGVNDDAILTWNSLYYSDKLESLMSHRSLDLLPEDNSMQKGVSSLKSECWR